MARRVTGPPFPGLILAAGASRRMPGLSKLARDWSDTTVLGAVIRCAGEADLEPLFVAVSSGTPEPESTGSFTVVRVARPEAGRAESLVAGLRAIPPGPVVVLLGDEPGIKAADIRTLTVAWDPGSADMARIRYQDRPGHPVLFGPAARHRAQELEGDALIWETLCQERFAAMEVAVNRLAPIDVDSPADLRRARHRETME